MSINYIPVSNISINCFDSYKLLGIKMSRDITDRHLSSAVQSFYRKSNKVLLDFAAVTSNMKLSLFSTYCMDAYRFI